MSQSGKEGNIFFSQDSKQILLEKCNELSEQRPFSNSYSFLNLGSSRVSDKIALVSTQSQNKWKSSRAMIRAYREREPFSFITSQLKKTFLL